MSKFTVGKYTMRNGEPATIYEISDGGALLGVCGGSSRREAMRWYSDGRVCRLSSNGHDLMPQKKVAWLNIYPEGVVYGEYESKACADMGACPDRIACIRVEYEEGEGL